MVDEFIAGRDCPKDCPFLDRVASGETMRFCSFSVYADILEPGRHTRTEVSPDGEVDYNIPPNCKVYDKYKSQKKLIASIKRKYKAQKILRLDKHPEPHLLVTGAKHSPVWKRFR